MPPNSRHPPPANPPPASQHPAYNAMPTGFQNVQNFYPNTATQADLQHILRLVNELAEINANNRKETNLLIEGVQHMATKQKQSESLETDNEMEGQATSSADSAEYILLQNKHADISRRFDQQRQIIVRYADILSDYEDTMRSMMVRVREFANAHTTTLLEWHKYYNNLLQKERDEKHELFCENSQKEETLAAARAKVSDIKSHMVDCELPWMKQVAYLKAENRFLRHKLGVPYEDGSDSEENNVEHPNSQTTKTQIADLKSEDVDRRSFDAIQAWRRTHRLVQIRKHERYERERHEDKILAMEEARKRRMQDSLDESSPESPFRVTMNSNKRDQKVCRGYQKDEERRKVPIDPRKLP